jgi:hypothetical protein
MRIIKSARAGVGLALIMTMGLLTGCTHYNPTTGQSEVDYGATAGVAGAAMGAAALGVALSNNNNDRYYGGGYYGGGYGGRGPVVYKGGNKNVYVNNSKAISNSGNRRPGGYNQSLNGFNNRNLDRNNAGLNRPQNVNMRARRPH